MLIEKKFTDADFQGQNIKSLPDRPSDAGITTEQLKAMFDNVAETVVAKGRINEVIDILTGVNGASSIGTANGKTVEEMLGGGAETLESHMQNQDIHVPKSKILTKDNSEAFTPTGEYQPVTKKYVDNKDAVTNETIKSHTQNADIHVPKSKILTKDNTEAFTPTGEYQPVTKKYVDNKDAVTNETIKSHTQNADIHVPKSKILTKDNTEAFTPTGEYQPVTKKYVDDKVVETGAADMQQAVYDPKGKKCDIFEYSDRKQYDDTAITQKVSVNIQSISALNSTVGTLQTEVGGKAPLIHTHTTASVTGLDAIISTLQSNLAQKASLSTAVTATLLVSAWQGEAAPFSQTLSITGVTLTSNIEILPSAAITAEGLKTYQSANLQDGGQASGRITLLCFGAKPTADIPIRIIKRGD